MIEWLERTLAPAAHLPWRAHLPRMQVPGSARECRCQPTLPGAQPGEDQRHQLILQPLLRIGGGYEISRLVLVPAKLNLMQNGKIK
jgi:hypothetical protein